MQIGASQRRADSRGQCIDTLTLFSGDAPFLRASFRGTCWGIENLSWAQIRDTSVLCYLSQPVVTRHAHGLSSDSSFSFSPFPYFLFLSLIGTLITLRRLLFFPFLPFPFLSFSPFSLFLLPSLSLSFIHSLNYLPQVHYLYRPTSFFFPPSPSPLSLSLILFPFLYPFLPSFLSIIYP